MKKSLILLFAAISSSLFAQRTVGPASTPSIVTITSTSSSNGGNTVNGLTNFALIAGAGVAVTTNTTTQFPKFTLSTTASLINGLFPSFLITNGVNVAITFSNAVNHVGSNYFDGPLTFKTNQNQIVPDFSLAAQKMTTNASFTFLTPVGVDVTKTTLQTTAIYITNSAGNSTLTITVPANVHAVGTANVTNLTRVTFECHAQEFTNAFFVQIF